MEKLTVTSAENREAMIRMSYEGRQNHQTYGQVQQAETLNLYETVRDKMERARQNGQYLTVRERLMQKENKAAG